MQKQKSMLKFILTALVMLLVNFLPQGTIHANDTVWEQTIYSHVQQYRAPQEAQKISKDIVAYAKMYNVNPILATAIFTEESHFTKNAVSGSGAVGISQLMPNTAAYLQVNPWNEEQNILGGIKYLSQLTQHYAGRTNADIYIEAAYNAGPGAVDRAGGIPDYTETRNYVQKVERTKSYIQQLAARHYSSRGY